MFYLSRGLFVTIHDLGHVRSVVANWPGNKVKVGTCCAKIINRCPMLLIF